MADIPDGLCRIDWGSDRQVKACIHVLSNNNKSLGRSFSRCFILKYACILWPFLETAISKVVSVRINMKAHISFLLDQLREQTF